jgi:transposase
MGVAVLLGLPVRGQRVAAHRRSFVRGHHTTDSAHMPKAHQRHLEWTPSRLIDWARTIGPQTAALVEAILADRPHPEQGYRSCLGILRLAKRYGPERLEAACARAGAVEARSYRHVDSILKHGLDRLTPAAASPQLTFTPVQNTCVAGTTTSEKERRCSLRLPSRNSTPSSSPPWRRRGRINSIRST